MDNINQKIGKYRWTICSLIFFATTINYLDRQVIGILKPWLESEVGIGEAEYGYIVFSFQLAYAIGMILAGRIIDKIGTKIGYAFSLLGWSIAAVLHAFATGPIGFGFFRALLGISEAGNFPAAIKATAEWFPKKERALATGIFNSGANVGAVIAPLTVPLIAESMGWQWAFILTGAVGLIWLVFWFILYEIPRKQKRLSAAELEYIESDKEELEHGFSDKLSWVKLLKYRQTWAFAVGKFLTDPIWWFFLFWIPGWLSDVRGVSVKGSGFGLSLAVIYTCTTFGSIFGGWLSSYFLKIGWTAHKSRSTAMLIFALMVVPILFVQDSSVGLWGAIALISLAASAHQAWSANIFTVASDMFPKKAIGSVIGIGGMAGAVGGMLVAVLAGNILEYYKGHGNVDAGYLILFFIAAFAYIIAWILMNLLAPKWKKVEDL